MVEKLRFVLKIGVVVFVMLAGFAADNHRDPSEKLEEDACDLSRVEAEGKTKGSIWQMMLILMKEPKV